MRFGQAMISAASISFFDALPFGRLWYAEPHAISNANWLGKVGLEKL
jgi:hypothetical protein